MEIESLEHLDRVLASRQGLRGVRLQDLDLTRREDALLAADPRGAVVLGGVLTPALNEHLRSHGAVIFPVVPGCPVDVYRAHLYDPDELYRGLEAGYEATVDARAYTWSRDGSVAHDALTTLLRAMHDDAVADALDEAVLGRGCVGVMGGHALARGGSGYRDAALLGRALARAGYLVLTGGGPGAMEAANLGARLHELDEEALEVAVEDLGATPDFADDVTAWARTGMAVRRRHPAPSTPASLGVPTWFYGHEPPNPFACLQAKFFSNAVREDALLARSSAGVVYLPGAAGTVQELFQAVTPGYYGVDGGVPLVLVGREHWTGELPVWPLLQSLSAGRPLARRLGLVSDGSRHADVLSLLDEAAPAHAADVSRPPP